MLTVTGFVEGDVVGDDPPPPPQLHVAAAATIRPASKCDRIWLVSLKESVEAD
jgi:hypothetical protein